MERHILIDALNIAPGGGAVVMGRVAGALAEQGARVTVLTGRAMEGAALPAGADRVPVASARGAARTQWWRHAALPAAARGIGADALLSFNLHSPAPLPQATLHLNLIPHLGRAERLRAVGPARASLLPAYARRAMRRSDANIFESSHLRDLAEAAAGPARGGVTAHVGADPPGHASAPAPHRIACVTSGARHKRNGLAIEIFHRYRARRPGAQLHLIGPADAILSSLGDAGREAALADPGIVLTGRLDRAALWEALGGAWALLAVSETESFYMVALEAMAAGCPVVGFDHGAMRESVGRGMPVLPPGDLEGAAQALASLDADRPRLSASARAWARRLPAGPCAARIARLVLDGTA